MNKQRFNKALKDTSNVQDELQHLRDLQQNYPYAQSIHVLLALALKQHNSDQAGNALNFAAMYVADRHNLKDLFSNKDAKSTKRKSEEIKEIKKEPQKETHTASAETHTATIDQESKKAAIEELKQKVLEKAENTIATVHTSKMETKNFHSAFPEEDDFRERLLKELETLQASKQAWQAGDNDNKDSDVTDNTGHKRGKKSVPEKIKQLTKSPKKEKGSAKSDTSKKVKTEGRNIKGDSPEKIKKQQELISKFIEKSPSLKAKANKPPIISAEQEDLSARSTSFKDSLISENLAEIMISQGKNDKAIEIYKKLIWKFPQKKAYFAARIEELTKQQG